MCGIAGLWHRDGKPVDRDTLARMTTVLAHRGPDDSGLHLDGEAGLGHRRLSIIDLSPAGHQPMANDDGTLHITYNGEIYNYIELRDELRSHGMSFRSSSDTEVLLKAYQRWGAGCVPRLNGIWAFAIWDSRKRELFCSRDRFGVKPFHYAEVGDTFVFGSEAKAVLASDLVERAPNWEVIHRYLALNLTHVDSQTFFRDIRELPAAHNLAVTRHGLDLARYWDLPPVGPADERSDETWMREYSDLLDDSTRLQMRSDVPVGCCLSGGLDSTSLTQRAAEQSSISMETFTAYLPHPSYDEREPVQAFAERMSGRISPHLVAPDLDSWFDEHKRVVYHHDEPHAGLIAAAQWEVMRRAHDCGVKVLLDGQGADESLGGYNFFIESLAADMLRGGNVVGMMRLLTEFEDRRGSGVLTGLGRLGRTALRATRSRSSLYALEGAVAQRALPLDAGWLGEMGSLRVPTIQRAGSRLDSEIATALQTTMLPTLLTFEDRSSMAFSIESRVPYLDHRLVELAFGLPRHLRVEGTRTKVILRRIMENRLPAEIVDAKLKKVFGTPYQLWFSPALMGAARELLGDRAFRERPFVDARRLERWMGGWSRGAGDRRMAFQVWNMVNMELWFRIAVDGTLSVTPATTSA